VPRHCRGEASLAYRLTDRGATPSVGCRPAPPPASAIRPSWARRVRDKHGENLTRVVEALKKERRKADAHGLFGLYRTGFPDPREEIDRLNEVVTRYRDLAGSLGDKLDAAEKELARLRDLLLVMSRRGFGLDQNATDEERADYWHRQAERLRGMARGAFGVA
jgi:hypothetical protein